MAKVIPTVPAMGRPCRSRAVPEKLTRRGTAVPFAGSGSACWAFPTEPSSKLTIRARMIKLLRRIAYLMTPPFDYQDLRWPHGPSLALSKPGRKRRQGVEKRLFHTFDS